MKPGTTIPDFNWRGVPLVACLHFWVLRHSPFYGGKPITRFLWLFTLGLLGFGQLLDLILLPGMIAQDVCSFPMPKDANS